MKKYLFPLLVLLLLAGCGKSDKELLDRASESIKNNNADEAVVYYNQILEKHPDSELAPVAAYELGRLYQGQIVTKLSKEESFKKAIESFNKVFENYPESKEAPTSLFMIGFIYANEFRNFEEATKAYNKFIQQFPEHELTRSAKDELDFMGLAPEDILAKKLSQGNK
jgi:TolA-binding protein